MKQTFLFRTPAIIAVLFATMFSMFSCKKEARPSNTEDDFFSNATAKTKSAPLPSKKLLVTGLKELQGSAVGPGQALYVTAPLDGTIWRINPMTGAVTAFTTGLPKRNPDPFYQGSGVVDVAFRGQTAFALVTGVASDFGGQDIVGIYRVDGPNSHTLVADIGKWSLAQPPMTEFFIPTGYQYAIEPYQDGFIVTDAHHNRLLYVTLDGKIEQIIALGNVAPTGLAVKGNTIYYTEAGPIPHRPEDARLMSFSKHRPNASEVATAAGTNVGLFVDVEFGKGNTLYTLAQGIWDGPYDGAPALPNTGALLKLKPNGAFDLVAGGLNVPTSMEFIGNDAYVISLTGEVWKIDNVSTPPFGH